jgi:zinc protease
MKLKQIVLALGLAAAAAAPSLAANATTASKASPAFDRKAYAIAYKKFVLPNGLTLLVHEDHSVPVVGVNVWYHVGSRNEKRGKTGFAHLFEHFFFNGSENYPHGFREAMDDLGANNRNGTTNTDRTNFFEDVPTSALERTLFLESDRMGFLGNYISQAMLERERGVVQNEKRQGDNQPYGKVRYEFSAKMYPYSHPYSWSTIGSMDDLNAASLEDIREWYRTYYGPNNAVLSLAGDVTPEKAYELVNKYFGALPPGPPLPRTEVWIPVLDQDLRDEMEDQVPQVAIYRRWHGPAWKDADGRRLDVLGQVLAGSKSARLTKRLVYDKGLATSVSAGFNDSELAGAFGITAMVKPGVDPKLVEREIDAVLADLLDKGPTADELARVKTSELAGYSRTIERLGGFGGRADLLAQSMTYGGTPDAYLTRLEEFVNSTPADVKAAGKRWLSAHHYTMTVKPYPKLVAAKSSFDRKQLPALGQAPDVSFPAMQRAQLKNGLKVVLLERHGAPIVNAALVLDAGAASDPAGKEGLASLSLGLIDKGTKTRNAFQLSDALESLGASIGAGTSQDQSIVRLQATSANLTPSLALLADATLNATFPQDQVELAKQRRLAQVGQEKAQPNALAVRVMPTLLYGANHAYGKPASGTEVSTQTISRDDVARWHEAWFRPGSATLVVAGDTTLEKLVPALEASFGKWQGGSAPAKQVPSVPATAGKRVYLIDKPDAPQSTIVAAHVSLPSGQPDELAIQAVMHNFGGMATSRLNRNLRLDKHWSYGTTARMVDMRGQRSFLTMAPVQTDKTVEAMQEVAKEIRDIAGQRPIAGEEFDSVMRNVTSRLPGRFATLDALEGAAITSINLGLPDDYWSRYAGGMRSLNDKQLAGAAARYVRPDEVVWLVIGDLRKVEPGIRKLGWGEVTVLDADGKPVR